MKVTIHLEGKNPAELADGLRAHLALFEGKKSKATKEETETFDLGAEDEANEEEQEEKEPMTLKEFRAAGAAFAGKSPANTAKMCKILSALKPKVKSLKDVPADKFEEVLSKLK